ncbi:hypothetical protein SH528x_004647 [Novipirellula sp. SH528]|uniref:hypothetical protein n=1 Tax=Novipirellula sp. SH528 TaxID=3454466 RepID=UPI003FA14604
MIGSLPSRPLLLERLESRCLLAAEFHAFVNGFDVPAASFHDEVRGVDFADREHSRDFRYDNAAVEVEHRDFKSQFDFGQHDRDDTFRETNGFLGGFRVEKILQPSSVLFASSADQVVLVLSFPVYRTPSGTAFSLVSATSPSEIISSVVRSHVANNAVEDSSSAKSLSNRTVAVGNLTPSVVDEVMATAVSSRLQALPPSTPSTSSVLQQQADETANPIVDASQSSRQLFLNRTSYNFTSPTPNQRNETIDFFPLHRDNPLMDSADGMEVNEADSWKMERGTLKRLRELTERPDAGPSETSDAVITGWVNGHAGFIDLQSDGVPLIAESAFDPTVSIVLDATLGMHRSLDLAAGIESRSSGGTIRDRVLAAIADDMSEFALPEATLSETRFSGLTYPGAVLAATALVLANRKRKHDRTKEGSTATPSRRNGLRQPS